MARNVLARLVKHQPEIFAALAAAWLEAGAHSFSIWCGNTAVAHWPADLTPDREGHCAAFALPDGGTGQLWVSGAELRAVAPRLHADTLPISTLLQSEAELDNMTEELIDTQDQVLALYALSRSMRSYLTVDATLVALAREAARLIKAPSAFAMLGTLPEPLVCSVPKPIIADADVGRLFEEVRASGAEWQTRNAHADTWMPPDIRSLLLLPIQVRGATGAMLGLVNKLSGFSAPDIKLASAIAEHAGAQIEKVLLYQETLAQARLAVELDVARRVQTQLLPQTLPQVPGIELAACSLPALEVGGDFFDMIWRKGRPLIFTVGDVTGKGMSAALVMAMTRRVLRSKASFLPDPSPELILTRASEDLYDDFSELGMLATTLVGQYEPVSGQLTFANAGHSPVIFRQAGTPARLLEADGTALGVFDESFSENQRFALMPGDLFVVATDGFTEARDPSGAMFGYDRLLREVDRLADRPAGAIVERLLAAIAEFAAGSPQDDDQTLVVLKRTA